MHSSPDTHLRSVTQPDVPPGAEPAARWRRPVVALFFGLLLLTGLLVHRDYGVSWDEVNNHLNGLVGLKYLAQLLLPDAAQREALQRPWIPDIRDFADSDHGAIFEMAASVLGYVFTNDDSRQFYFVRHLCVFVVFAGGVWALYRLARLRFQDWRLGLLAAAALVLSPRFFAEAFYNGKDIVYTALFTLAIYTLARLLKRPTTGRALVHALATAAAIDIRVQGLQLVLLTLLMLALEARYRAAAPAAARPPGQRSFLAVAGAYVPATLVITYLGWPYLWAMSWADLLHATSRMSAYPWPHTQLYLGEFVRGRNVPWHYTPVWLFVTTPLPYTLAALLGLGSWLLRPLRRHGAALRTFPGRLDALFVVWLLGPLLFVALAHSTLYDSWRHLYFIYPALLLLAVRGLQVIGRAVLPRWRGAARALAVLAGLEVARTAVLMVTMHPYQNVYFSFLPAATAERLFERDYWGLSYRRGLEWIMARDASAHIPISVPWHYPLYNNSLILPPADRARIQYVPGRDGPYRYFLTGYRWHPQSYADTLGREVYSIRANGIKILSVFER